MKKITLTLAAVLLLFIGCSSLSEETKTDEIREHKSETVVPGNS